MRVYWETGNRGLAFENITHLSESFILASRKDFDAGFQVTYLVRGFNVGVLPSEKSGTDPLLLPKTELALSYAILIATCCL